jgi:hypothetical protein
VTQSAAGAARAPAEPGRQILIFPRILNYLVGIYLILAGLLGLGLAR